MLVVSFVTLDHFLCCVSGRNCRIRTHRYLYLFFIHLHFLLFVSVGDLRTLYFSDPDHGSASASMRIRIQMRIRIHGVRNRPDKKSYTNFSWKCVFFFAFHGINLKGRNCSSDFNKNFLPNPLCLFTRSFMMRFACLPVCS